MQRRAEDVRSTTVVRVDDETVEGAPFGQNPHDFGLEMPAALAKPLACKEMSDDMWRERFGRVHAIGDQKQCTARVSLCYV